MNGPEVPVDQPSASWLHSLVILMCGSAFLNCGDTSMATVDLFEPPTMEEPNGRQWVTHKVGPPPNTAPCLIWDLSLPYPMGLP